MAINETKIIIKAVDNATPVFESLNKNLGGVGTAMDGVSKKTSGLTGYIKEQRKEGRQHSFIIGEMKDALGLAGLAMNVLGGASKDQNETFKKVNDSINKGIVAFFGLDAAVSVLSKTFKTFGGWVGIAVTAIGSILIAMMDYLNTSKSVEEQNKKTEESFDLLSGAADNLSGKLKGTRESNIAFVEATIAIVEAERNSLNQRQKIVEEANHKIGLSHRGLVGSLIPLTEAEKAIKKEFEENKIKINELNGRTNVLSSTLFGLSATITAKGVPSLKDLEEAAKRNQTHFGRLVTILEKVKVPKLDLPKLAKVEVPEFKSDLQKEAKGWSGLFLSFQSNFDEIMQQMSQSVDIFQGFSNNAFEERMNNYDREIEKLNKLYDTSAERINTDYSMRIAAAQGNADLIIALEAERDAKLLELRLKKEADELVIENRIKDEKRKNFIANQNAAAIQATINGALAVSKALADGNVATAIFAGIMALAQIAIIKSQPIPNFHTGGSMFFNAPADQERPVMVRGQETIRVTTPQQERNKNNGGVIINFNSPVGDVEFVKNSIKKVLKLTGLSVEKAFVNNRNKLSFA